ncbi:uncharacterized protein M437DRAFT_78354 [Aureobasidium melanogenum CBS 110374]|uniref:RING-type domain-containing protein n=1 Tax=Aureobasidium melanogenum (strain CBS 110374) TaxID=1043003 RepID=A0A074W9L5_AURM1|nr:uncharacterized protein M437DRAFT_78354 [Aureobasidium melanogenum CBS 110374]KEQ59216.1 hypothetical protein M437DRAFT_78354 [Aureobasidium melanogenum CBS 110374]
MPEIEYTIPSHIFAESCPMCDEIALDEGERREGFVARYPRGWVLVACKRHVDVLRTTNEVPEAPPSNTITIPTTASATAQDPCPICISNPPHLHLDCNHAFCTPCLTNWQTASLDTSLSSWLTSTPLLLPQYPILAATLKSRFTCPMCRTNLQFTKQSRRKKKMRNQRARGEELTGGIGARSRRGGQRNRRRRGGREVPCVEAPPSESMPVVERAQASQNDFTGVE